jgi:hypothetical protein
MGTSRPMAMVDDVSAKVLSDLGHHGYEHYGAGRVDAVADGLFVRTGFWWVINDGVDHLANFSTGFSDTLTVGGTRWFRGRYGMDYIDYDSLAYTGGQVTGAVVGFGLGFTGSAAAGGVLYSVARGYNAIETTVAVTQATRNLINGERNLGDALAFAPALGVAAKQLTKISGLLPRAGNVPKSGDLMSEAGQLGGDLFPTDKIPGLVKYLDRRGIYVHEAMNGSFDGVRGVMTLPRNPTKLNVRHELSHMLDYRKYGDDYYKLFTPAQREQMVLERLKNNRIWDKLNDAERDWSLNYPSTRR